MKHKGVLIRTVLVLAALLSGTLTLGPAAGSVALADAGGDWQPVAGPLGGSVAAVAVSPAYATDHTAFAAVRGYGVYRTTDAGRSWARVTPDEERSGWVIVGMAVSPHYVADRTLFVATSIWTHGGNVYRSTDGGDSWQVPDSHPDGMSPGTSGLAISPDFARDSLIYALSGRGILRSTDGGQNFATLDPPWFGAHGVQALAFSPAFASDRTLIASVEEEGLYRSADAGATWVPIGHGLPAGGLRTLALSPAFHADGTALVVASGQTQVVYRTTDGGDNWAATDLAMSGGDHWLAFSPGLATDGTAFAGGQNDGVVYRSTDGGQHWSAFGEGLPGVGSFDLAPSPDFGADGVAFLAHSAGVYRIAGDGVWNPVLDGLPRLYVGALDVGPPGSETLFAGAAFFESVLVYEATAYEGNVHRSTDGGDSWRPVSPRLERVVAVAVSPDYDADRTVFAATGYMAKNVQAGHVYRSTDGGESWPEMPDLVFLQALALSPDYAHDRTVFAVSAYPPVAGLHRSTDGGQSWAELNTVYTGILAVSPGYAADGLVFTADFEHLLRSTDRGDTWMPVFEGAVSVLVLSPHFDADGTAYLVADDALYRSGDAGLSWQRVSADLPAPADVLAFGPAQTLYAGVRNGGVYRSTDGGRHWEPAGSFPAGRRITTLEWRPDDWTLYAGTDAGLWAYSETPFGDVVTVARGASLPAVASLPGSDRFLAVWDMGPAVVDGTHLRARFVSNTGQPIGPEFAPTSPGGQQHIPSVTANPRAGEFLVTWWDSREQPGDIYGQRLTADGRLIGDDFLIAHAANFENWPPAVAYNPMSDEYLAVWYQDRGEAGGSNVYGQRVSADGSPVGGVFTINDEGTPQVRPAVAASSATGEYLAVWSLIGPELGRNLYGQRLAGSGERIGEAIPVGQGDKPAVAYNSVSGEYLVVWADGSAQAARVRPDGSVMGGIALSEPGGSKEFSDVASDAAGGYVAIWDGPGGDDLSIIFGRELSSEGELRSPQWPVGYPPGQQMYPAMAYDAQAHVYLAAWEERVEGEQVVRGRIYRPGQAPPPPGPPAGLVNGGFEEGFYELMGRSIPHGWAVYPAVGQPSYAGERSTVHSGQWAYKLSGYESFAAGLAQAVRVQPGRRYRITAYYHLYPPGDGQAFLGVQDGASAPRLVGDNWPGAWRPLSQVITAKSDRLIITLQGSSGADPNTNVYFDDVTVVAVGSP